MKRDAIRRKKKKSRRLTLVVIPDVNSSVYRFKLWLPLIYFMLAILLALMLLLATEYWLHQHSLQTISQLRMRLSSAQIQLKSTVSDRDSKISTLQNQVITLSNQAKSVQLQVSTLKALESQIQGIVPGGSKLKGGDVKISSDLKNTAPKNLAKAEISSSGKGGPLIPVNHQQIMDLAVSTSSAWSTLNADAASLQKRFNRDKAELLKYQHQQAITPTIWPTISHSISSPYGYRVDPINGQPSFHDGVDIAGRRDDPIFSTADGTVVEASYDRFRGNHVIVDHGNGIKTEYMHMTKILVKVGQHVKKGRKIGLLGTTGRSTGPHVHYSVFKNGKTVNPMNYIPH